MKFDDVKPQKYVFDRKILEETKNEDDFNLASFNFINEIKKYCIIICTFNITGDKIRWNRNEAIIFGLIIRIVHLLNGYLSEISEKSLETALLFQRSLIETCVNIIYLMNDDTDTVYDDYVHYSLRHEKKLYEKILKNISQRGSELGIEKRMKKSIESVFIKSGVKIEDVDLNNKKCWGINIKNRFEKVGLVYMYDSAMGGGSHNVHGNWEDLLSNYLDYNNDGTFKPKKKQTKAKPQPMNALARILIIMIKNVLVQKFPDSYEKTEIEKRIIEIEEDVEVIDSLHEVYLNKKYNILET